MNNYKGPAEVVTLVAPYTRAAGEGAKVGNLFGVAVNDVTSGDEGEFALCGAYVLPKTTGAAWTQGELLYWDDSGKKLTVTAVANLFVGVALVAADSADTTGTCRLNGVAPQFIDD